MERPPRLRSALLARISRLGAKSGHAPGRSRDVYSVRDVPQAAAVLAALHRQGALREDDSAGARASALHLTYIERDGVERDGSPGRLYGAGNDTPVRELISTSVAEKKRQFRFIVSPEDAREIDLTAFTGTTWPRWRRISGGRSCGRGEPLEHRQPARPCRRSRPGRRWARSHDRRPLHQGGAALTRRDDADVRARTTNADAERRSARARGRTGPFHVSRPSVTDPLRYRWRATGDFVTAERSRRGGEADRQAPSPRTPRPGEGIGGRVAVRTGWDATLREIGQTGDIIKRMRAAVTWPDPSRFAIVDESTAVDPTRNSGESRPRVTARPNARALQIPGLQGGPQVDPSRRRRDPVQARLPGMGRPHGLRSGSGLPLAPRLLRSRRGDSGSRRSGLSRLGSLPKAVTHVVQVDRLGGARYFGPSATTPYRPGPDSIKYYLRQFVHHTRSLTSDAEVLKTW